MRFIVRGADRQSGQDRELVIDAGDAENAQWQAEQSGLLVASISATAAPRQSAIDYATPQPRIEVPARYTKLSRSAGLAEALGAIAMFFALLIFLATMITAGIFGSGAATQRTGPLVFAIVVVGVSWAFIFAAIGVILSLAGYGAEMLRDIALGQGQ